MELEEMMEQNIKIMEDDFYKKKFHLSYSSLNKLMWNPEMFHQMYILGIREEKQESHLVQGKIIHCLLLEPDKFNNYFLVSPDNLPTGNLKTVIDRVFGHHTDLKRNGDERQKLDEFQDAIIDIMKDMNYHQSLKTDSQRIDKILTQEGYNYWSFLQMKGDKILIDQESFDFCYNAVELIKLNKNICKLLGMQVSEFNNVGVINEYAIQVDLPGKPFGLKGIIDNIVLDHDKKIIYINDVKTTSKDLKDFPESIEYYNYWMQAVIYCTMVNIAYQDLIVDGYEMKFHFVVIDRNFQTYAFPVRETTLVDWLDKLNKCIDKAEWHYINRSYELPYEFATGSIIL